MKGLTKVLFAAGAVVAATEIANEVLGVSTKADTWYKGKFSIANGIRYLINSRIMPEEKQALAKKNLDVINTFDFDLIDQLNKKISSIDSNKTNDDEERYKEDCKVIKNDLISMCQVKIPRL